jgi:uncharacterized protein YchJ
MYRVSTYHQANCSYVVQKYTPNKQTTNKQTNKQTKHKQMWTSHEVHNRENLHVVTQDCGNLKVVIPIKSLIYWAWVS